MTGRRGYKGTHLPLITADKTFDIHAGPSRFLKEKRFNVVKGDEIEVMGATAQVAGSEALIALEIRKGGEALVLHDAQGIPKWSRGWRR